MAYVPCLAVDEPARRAVLDVVDLNDAVAKIEGLQRLIKDAEKQIAEAEQRRERLSDRALDSARRADCNLRRLAYGARYFLTRLDGTMPPALALEGDSE